MHVETAVPVHHCLTPCTDMPAASLPESAGRWTFHSRWGPAGCASSLWVLGASRSAAPARRSNVRQSWLSPSGAHSHMQVAYLLLAEAKSNVLRCDSRWGCTGFDLRSALRAGLPGGRSKALCGTGSRGRRMQAQWCERCRHRVAEPSGHVLTAQTQKDMPSTPADLSVISA